MMEDTKSDYHHFAVVAPTASGIAMEKRKTVASFSGKATLQ